jgi:hypothetical protein
MEKLSDPPIQEKIRYLKTLAVQLPSHWRVVGSLSGRDWLESDDGRDYSVPFFARKDGLARVYINEDEWYTFCMFAIVWDEHPDGDCCGYEQDSFLNIIKYCDEYVEKHPIPPERMAKLLLRSLDK